MLNLVASLLDSKKEESANYSPQHPVRTPKWIKLPKKLLNYSKIEKIPPHPWSSCHIHIFIRNLISWYEGIRQLHYVCTCLHLKINLHSFLLGLCVGWWRQWNEWKEAESVYKRHKDMLYVMLLGETPQ